MSAKGWQRMAAALDFQVERQDVGGRLRDRIIRQAVTRAAARTARHRWRPFWTVTAMGLAAAAALLVWWPRTLSYQVEGGAPLATGWVEASEGANTRAQFSDGSVLELNPAARARVIDITPHGARVALASGRLHASIAKRRHTAWSFSAGPFEVRVTGTRFSTAWDAPNGVLTIDMEEGSVIVAGGPLGSGRPLHAGEHLRVSSSASPVAAHAIDDRVAAPAPTLGPPPPAAAGRETERRPSRAAPRPVEAGWRVLARAGRYDQAMHSLDTRAFLAECRDGAPDDLLALGDVARLTGDGTRAEHAYLALRRRFPADPRAPTAGFALGRMAFDQRRDYAAAATWFATYLKEQPGGRVAREAAGRLIEARQLLGDQAGARAAARQYLAGFPGGPHAELARRVLQP